MKLKINVDPGSQVPLTHQLYEELRNLILSGKLRAGERIPSSRALAEQLGVSRPTVTQAYEQLLAEGYVQGRHGSGTYVCGDLSDGSKPAKPAGQRPAARSGARQLSSFGRSLQASRLAPARSPEAEISFYCWRPAFEEFPVVEWARSLWRHARLPDVQFLDYASDPQGYLPLRESIAEFVCRYRGFECDPGQVLIAMGLQQALDLAARLHVEQGDTVVVENPSYPGARNTFKAHGCDLLPVPVDESGLVVERLPDASAGRYKLTYVTPSHQFPTGAVLSLRRRLELLAWAARAQALIFEDDYDSEYRYAGRPIPALQGLDGAGSSVVFAGSFSKVLLPSMRLGYLVVPPELVDKFAAARFLSDRHSSIIDQAAMCDFIGEGHFGRHIRRMRELYSSRLEVLRESVRHRLDDVLNLEETEAGLHTVGWLGDSLNAEVVARAGLAHRLELFPISRFALKSAGREGFLMGFAGIDTKEIRRGVDCLAVVFDRLIRGGQTALGEATSRPDRRTSVESTLSKADRGKR